MIVLRFLAADGPHYGALDGELVQDLGANPQPGQEAIGPPLPLASLTLLAPVIPSKIVGIGRNYREHAIEMGGEPPAWPDIFIKPSTCVIGPDQPIELPAASRQVEIESELAVVIGGLLRDATPEQAANAIFGYTIINDVTARDLQRADRTWARGKGHDTFAPLGPWVVTELDASDLLIEGFINRERKQSARTSTMIHQPAALLSYISQVMTLLPGDVVATGTPAGVSQILPGDVVEIVIEGIGKLRNPVVPRGRG